MLLNRIEFAVTNNPVRILLQRHLEAKWFLAQGGRMNGGRALELGCGQGVGVGIILDEFGAERVDAFDLDARMLARAGKRTHRYGDRVHLWQADATAIPVAEGCYDAVFDFDIIHHIPAWRVAIREVHRVLRPGGVFYAGEVLAKFILSPLARALFDHPLEDRFGHAEFRDALVETGFDVLAVRHLCDRFGWFVARK